MRAHTWTITLLGLALAGCGTPDDTDDTGVQDTDTGEDTDTDTGDTAPANQAPTAAADGVLTDEDTPTVVITVKTNDTDPDGDPLDVTAIDTTGMTGTATLEDDDAITWHPGASYQTLGVDETDTTSFTYTLSDGEHTANGTVTITISGVNDAPVLTTPSTQSHDEGTLINLPLVATDLDGPSLAWSATGLPGGLAISATTGRIQGRISATSAPSSPYTVQVTVSDGFASDDATFTWNVAEANVPPLYDEVGDQANAEADVVSLQIVADDPEGQTVTFTADNLPPGLSIGSSSGEITGTVSYVASAGSPYDVTIHAFDGDITGDLEFTWAITDTNRAPSLTDPGGQGDAEGDTISLDLVATDPDDDDTLTFSASGLPDGLSIDTDTGTIAGTLSYAASGAHTVSVTVSDGDDTDEVQFGWTVTNTNQPPEFTGPPDQSDAEGDTIELQVDATDADGQTIEFSATGLPDGLLIDPDTGLIEGKISFDAEGVHTVTITADDGEGPSEHTFEWTVSHTNQAPVWSGITGRLDAEGDVVSVTTYTATDGDGDDIVFSAQSLPTGLSIDPDDGTITGTVSYDATGSTGTFTFRVTLTADDGVDATEAEFDWDIDAVNREPVIEDIGDQGDMEGTTVSIPVGVTDPDGDGIASWSASNLPPGLTITQQPGGSATIEGTISYDAAAGSPYEFTLYATDIPGAEGEGTWSYNVDNVPQPVCPRVLIDVTDAWGLSNTGPASAVAWLDLEHDGDLDLFLRESGVYANDRDQFTDAGGHDGFDPGTGPYGLAVGDPDGNGFLDVFVPNDTDIKGFVEILAANFLYMNQGLDPTAAWAGFADKADEWNVNADTATPGASAFVDADGDGDHDLTFAAEFGSSHHYVNVGAASPPFDKGDDLFDPVTGLGGQGLAWADFDASGGADLYVVGFADAIDDARLYLDEGGGWKDVAADNEALPPKDANYGGPTWVDIDGDGLLDLHVVAVAIPSPGDPTPTGEPDLVFIRDPSGGFKFQEAAEFGIGDSEVRNSAANWVDYDADGDLDVLLVDAGLYANDGVGGFTDVTHDVFGDNLPGGAQAAAWGDVDGDDDLDLLLAGVEGVRLYLNQEAKGGAVGDSCATAGTRRLDVLTDLDGSAKDESGPVYPAIGATITVDVDGDDDFAPGDDKDRLAVYVIGQAQSGRAAVNDLSIVLGLGDTDTTDIQVVFPDGSNATFYDVVADTAPLVILDE